MTSSNAPDTGSVDHARFRRDFDPGDETARDDPAALAHGSAAREHGDVPIETATAPQAPRSTGVDLGWIIALFAVGVALMVGAVLLYKAGWLAQGSGTYAIDSYGEQYSATIGRTLDDIVFEDFLFTINPYLFVLGAATVLGTLFLLASRGVRRRGARAS